MRVVSFGQMDNQIVVSDYTQMDRVLREERTYILNLVKQIKKAGCNVLLIQKSILRYEQQEAWNPGIFHFRCFSSGLRLTSGIMLLMVSMIR